MSIRVVLHRRCGTQRTVAIVTVLSVLLTLLAAPWGEGRTARADPAAPTRAAPAAGLITLYVGEAHVLEEPDVRRIAVGNGKVIQATALDDRQVLVLPEAPGQSTLVLWGRTGPERRYAFNVLGADTARLLQEVQAMLGEQHRVTARVVGDKVLVEGSDVSEELSARIAEIARRYPQVVNLVPKVGLERMIAMDVKFIEIRRELLENIGVRWSGAAQGPSFQVLGDLHRSAALQPGGRGEGSGLDLRARVAPFASSASLLTSIGSMLNFLVQNGDAVVLAEPRLSCRSGGTARFVAGGELPIPVSGALGTASVSFKEYGIKFDVSPVASESGLIAAKIATEISSINFEVAVREVPGLLKRRAETEVNLRENETLVIAGLLAEEGTRNMDRVAGAAELPVLGALFRSRQFRDRQSELVVFITPRFIDGGPMPPAAAAVGVGPIREPTRYLPQPTSTDGPPHASGEVMVAEPGPLPGSPSDAGPRLPEHSALAVPSGPDPSSRSPSLETLPATVQVVPAVNPDDRGTASRFRPARERVRMLD
jgi:pilus assembly protein CpaC